MTIFRTRPTFDVHVPVVIVGGGACGCVAALAAADAGVEVAVLERDAKPSGNTSLSGGQIPGAGTNLQRAAGIQDTAELLAGDLIGKARGQCDQSLARHIASASAVTIDWLVERHGLQLQCMTEFRYPGHSRLHMHAPSGQDGAALHAGLLRAVADSGVDIICSAKVTGLFAGDDGRIHGVHIERPGGTIETMGCDALILACNGYGGNQELLRQYIPEVAEAPYFGHPGNQGDAILWGGILGASIKDLAAFQGHGGAAMPYMTRLGWATMAEGGIQVDAVGKRFSNENAGYSEQALNIRRLPGGAAWAIWDERCERATGDMQCHRECWAAGAIRRFENASDLAVFIGCDRAALTETLTQAAIVAAGESPCPFARDFQGKPPLVPPYFCAKITGALFHTQGGLEVDLDARVLRQDGTPFPNLFAGGGAARGLSGPADWGYLSGSGLLMAVNLGRLAGETAAKLVRSATTIP